MSLRRTIVDNLESVFRFLYKWISEKDEVLGEIMRTIHLFIFWTLLVLVVVSHTVYPVFWFQAAIFSLIFIIWIQHIILKTCVLTSIELKLLGADKPIMIDSLLYVFGIPVQKESRMGVTIMLSSASVLFLGLELIARCLMYGRCLVGASTWI
jgi:hypothetical protein